MYSKFIVYTPNLELGTSYKFGVTNIRAGQYILPYTWGAPCYKILVLHKHPNSKLRIVLSNDVAEMGFQHSYYHN